ncbi:MULTISPECIES: rpoE leader peptide RseD [Citrobacter]|uniref:RpoE leader peptide RseD n=1 Tax=Citrobacter portucalensis TaxID=1639133 RepID=A0A5A9CDF5_9ENTR|nr:MULTISPECIES: rpoE leader peptide RseD [Citrobacter]EGS5520422.1 rpoE leader peptide RseD [Citrobacter freundii]MBD0806177.1 rpoE leader peptide RseD [Citrobacter sp. C13]NCB86938.1 rpoE leader peptide RseD [Gammaproteobacteria bacterium]RRN89031.1 rpoE leader peptide RseD [Morganella morganii]RXM23350.1 rpoE leader peptide RseD [Citrobacter sp. AAK_AS5]
MRDKTCLQHDKQKTMRNGTLRNLSTLSICLLIVKLMEWRFESAWKFGLGRLYLG